MQTKVNNVECLPSSNLKQDNRGGQVNVNLSTSDVHRSTSSFASSSPWSRWIFNRNHIESTSTSSSSENNSHSNNNIGRQRLSISEAVLGSNSEKVYSMLSNCSSPTNSSGRPSVDASDDSPVSLFHPHWIYENLPPPITPAPAVPDILEIASSGVSKLAQHETISQRPLFPPHRSACLPHCACKNTNMAATPNAVTGSRSPLDDDLKKDSRFGFVDRARMVSFKRKKVTPAAVGNNHLESDGSVCSQCTCFLDPVNLLHDSSNVVGFDATNSIYSVGSTVPSQSQHRHEYENTNNVLKTVILHTGFALPTGGHDLMLAMDSPRLKKSINNNHQSINRSDFVDICSGNNPKVSLANQDNGKRNKLNLTIDTHGENRKNENQERTGYFYDPIYEFLMSSPVMRKLKELGFQYPSFPTDVCNNQNKRLRILYVVIALLLLTVLALIILNVFVPKIIGLHSTSQFASANSSNFSIPTTTASPIIVISNTDQMIEYSVNAIDSSSAPQSVSPIETHGFSTDSSTAITSGLIDHNSTIHSGQEIISANTNTVSSSTGGGSILINDDGTGFPQPALAHFPETDSTMKQGLTTTTISTNFNTTQTLTTSATSLFPTLYPANFTCPEDKFKCRAGVSRMPCLDQWDRCDGIVDCSDGSDEELCDTIKCFGNFQCGGKTCVSLAKVCNGIFDCPDGSDELRCDKFQCQPDYEFRCPSGYCIPNQWKCDGEGDCPDHFDEYNCSATCSPSYFRCPEGWCIPGSWRCNGIRDCAGGQDEENCACAKSDQLKCASGGGRCVDKERLCDGIPDCPDSSDEWNCVVLQGDSLVIRDQISDELLPICSQDWLAQDADLACRQLGYEKSDRFWEIPFQNENLTDLYIRSTLTQTLSFNVIDRVQFLVKKKPANSCTTKKTIAISCQKFECGHWHGDDNAFNENRVRRMLGGRISREHEWPSVAVLYHPEKKWACTASVIAPYWLITSALCVRRTGKSPIDWQVIAGRSDPSVNDLNHRSILRFVQHPSYKFIPSSLADYDVMLVQLSSPLPMNNQGDSGTINLNTPVISSICLPDKPTPPGTRCITAGWGYTSPGGYVINKQLKHLPVGVWPKEVCNSTAHYPGLLSERSICASNDRDDWGPCFNDEGSPLMCQYPGSSDRWYLAGVLTAQSCGSAVKHPAVFADVYSMRNWINGVIGRPVIT